MEKNFQIKNLDNGEILCPKCENMWVHIKKPLTKKEYKKNRGNIRKKSCAIKSKIIFDTTFNADINSNNFLPTWDYTDHFSFCCENCVVEAEILGVDFRNIPCKDYELFVIYFRLGCQECGETGYRKISFENPHRHSSFHHTFDCRMNTLFHFKNGRPYQAIKMRIEKKR